MATAGAIIGLAVDGVDVDDNIGTTAKTLPDFPAMWAANRLNHRNRLPRGR